ncbi:hypothetical protein ACFE04_000177 [Oxalis oulophora]
MTVDDVKVEETVVVAEEVTVSDDSNPKTIEKCSSYKEESNFLSDLKESERKALIDLKSKLEEAIFSNTLFKKEATVKIEKADNENEKPVDKKVDEDEQNLTPAVVVEEEEQVVVVDAELEKILEIDEDIAIWGVPLNPRKCDECTDVVLLKFLRARDFKPNDAFEMLVKTLQWRKEAKMDAILDEKFEVDFSPAGYMNGSVDREGHPVCYNVYGVFDDKDMYKKALGTEEKREQFLRWRFQLLERGIQKLDLKPGGVASILQISDLKNSPGVAKKELRSVVMKAVTLLQDNYPEFVARNVFINVPFWYYALNALLSPFLTQRTKAKFDVTRPAKVTETLLKYIPIEEIPIQYGGFKRDDDFEFSSEDGLTLELIVMANSTESIELQAEMSGSTLIWDLQVLGWEVNYKEEFVPSDEGYTVIVKKGKKMGSQEGPIRNTYTSNEPGKVVITIENGSRMKKKVLYRYKTKKSSSF